LGGKKKGPNSTEDPSEKGWPLLKSLLRLGKFSWKKRAHLKLLRNSPTNLKAPLPIPGIKNLKIRNSLGKKGFKPSPFLTVQPTKGRIIGSPISFP